jgi:hypothetical protein
MCNNPEGIAKIFARHSVDACVQKETGISFRDVTRCYMPDHTNLQGHRRDDARLRLSNVVIANTFFCTAVLTIEMYAFERVSAKHTFINKITVLRDATPYDLVDRYERFVASCGIYHHSTVLKRKPAGACETLVTIYQSILTHISADISNYLPIHTDSHISRH